MKKYITLDNLKQKNTSDILLYVMDMGKTSRREIQKSTGFSWGTVSTNVSYLIEKGYVKEVESDQLGVGRKTSYLVINGDKIVGLGIDVNRTGVSAIICSLDGEIKYSKLYDFTAETQNDVISLMEEIINGLVVYCKDKYEIKSLGISFQGEIDGEKGFSFAFPGINDWQTINIKEYFFNKYDIPIYFEHDPKCMLYSLKADKNAENVLLIRADDGIGLSVMQNGKIMEDQKKLELGHTLILSNNNVDKCKNLEYYASASGISKRANTTFNSVKENPGKFIDYISQATEFLSVAIYNLYVLFRPEKIILTGQLFSIDMYEKMLKDNLNRLILDDKLSVETDLNLSAAKGVALNALKYNVKIKL